MRGACVVLLMVVAGCSDENVVGDAGPPEVLQMFVRENDGVFRLAAGHHCDVDGMPAREGEGCAAAPRFPDNAGPVTKAKVGGDEQIRLVFDEHLLRSTASQYQCACWPYCETHGFTFADDAQLDASQCTSCADSPGTSTQDETGKCVDADGDHAPDTSLLQPGTVSLRCGTTDIAVTADQGSYSPIGNQYIATSAGIEGLGPVMSFRPLLPLDSLCTVTVSPSLTDGDGLPIHVGFALTFHTEHQPP